MDRETDYKKEIKYGSIISYITIGINIILGLCYTPWILKEVGSSDYGLYTLASTLIALFLMDFGMGSAVTRFVSNFRASRDQESINSFVGMALKFYIVICSLIAVILIVVFLNIETIYSQLTPDEMSSFKVVFLITAFFVVICFPGNVFNGVLNAYEKYIAVKVADVLNKIVTVIVTIIVLTFHGGIFELVFVNGFFNLVTMIVKAAFVYSKTPVRVRINNSGEIKMGEIVSFSAWTTIQTLSNQMLFNLVPTILAMVANTFAITLYGFANVIEGYTYNITQAINGLFMPSVSRILVNEKDARKVLPLMVKVGRINQSVVSLLIIGVAVLGKEFVSLWVGDEYSDLYYCIMALIVPYFISASQQIGNTSIVVLNKVKFHALINLSTGVVNLIGSYFIAQYYGVIGVCCITGFVFIARVVLLNIVYVKLNIKVSKFFVECQIKMLPALVISFVLSIAFNRGMAVLYPRQGWIAFGIKVVVISTLYFLTMWLLGWNKEEKELIKSFATKIRITGHKAR